MLAAALFVFLLSLAEGGTASSIHADYQLRCPKSTKPNRVTIPAITQIQQDSGEWENILECWSVNTTTINMPDIDNAFRLDWENGFDAAYQYIFYEPSFMPAHPAPKPSLIIMSVGIGDLRMPSGRCLRITAGDIFFSVGTEGRQTAWWSEGTVVSDLYFKDDKIPDHTVVAESTNNHELPQTSIDEL
ncbi:hypothetical protein E0Z10_g10943 [Xylaria hypoxylon]|uniref:(S)-ureidoglycine aminohydrolase cupin domain-containing protein n=1 Tax=Xylaria hypoxylon TaxID=37992 RepID=A0A4Z0YA91_9PEZI|nr:hypothetical protein E0Z10_g10943 [Xylaria hypoxylon]